MLGDTEKCEVRLTDFSSFGHCGRHGWSAGPMMRDLSGSDEVSCVFSDNRQTGYDGIAGYALERRSGKVICSI